VRPALERSIDVDLGPFLKLQAESMLKACQFVPNFVAQWESEDILFPTLVMHVILFLVEGFLSFRKSCHLLNWCIVVIAAPIGTTA